MADYAAIIAEIDAAVVKWAGKPINLSGSGRSVTYRSLKELTEARTYYQSLLSTAGGKKAFHISGFGSGSSA